MEGRTKLKGDPEDEEERKKVKESIDKYGRVVDKDKELQVVLPAPAYGKEDPRSIEENMDDDEVDSWLKRKRELERLRAKKRRGEELTE